MQTLSSAPRRESAADRDGRTRLLRAVRDLAVVSGVQATELPGVEVFRAVAPTTPAVVDYRLGLCVTVQGRKCVQFGAEEIDYGPLIGLLVALPLPLQARVVEASPEQPCLAMVVELPPAVVSETADALDQICPRTAKVPGVRQLPIHGPLLDALLRVARTAASRSDSHILGADVKREVIYRILQTDQGGLLRSLALESSGAHRIQRVIRHMHDNLASRITIAQMAEVAHMSESSLHQVFKSVTSMSPLQYLKRIRLQTARSLMLDAGLNAGEAADEVGYNSASQFSREFKALYGVPPSRAHSA